MQNVFFFLLRLQNKALLSLDGLLSAFHNQRESKGEEKKREWGYTSMVRQGFNFNNIFLARFLYKSAWRSFTLVHFGFVIFWQKDIGKKILSKMLMKLTIGGWLHHHFMSIFWTFAPLELHWSFLRMANRVQYKILAWCLCVNKLMKYRAFHGFGQAKFPDGGSVLGSSQFKQLPQLS